MDHSSISWVAANEMGGTGFVGVGPWYVLFRPPFPTAKGDGKEIDDLELLLS